MTQPDGTYPLLGTVAARLATEVTTYGPGAWLLSFIPRDRLDAILSKHFVEPNLEKCEALIDTFLPTIETKEDRELRKTMTRQERVDRITQELSDQGVEATGNVILQMVGQAGFDRIFKAASDHGLSVGQQAKVVFADRAFQVGAVLLFNTALTTPTIKAQEFVSKLFQKYFHLEPEDADERATRTFNERIPSLAGMVASIVMHRHYSLKP